MNKQNIITSDFSQRGEKSVKSQIRIIADKYNVECYTSIDEYKWFN